MTRMGIINRRAVTQFSPDVYTAALPREVLWRSRFFSWEMANTDLCRAFSCNASMTWFTNPVKFPELCCSGHDVKQGRDKSCIQDEDPCWGEGGSNAG